MAMKFLKFGNHFLKTAFYLARDVIIGHIYKKKYVEQTVDALYMQVFRPKESITVNSVLTYDTISVTSSANGIMILEGDGSTDTSKWKIVASTKNNNQEYAKPETIDGKTVYAHRWSFFDPFVMIPGKVYAIQINYSKYTWSMTQYDYAGTIQDDQEQLGSFLLINSWMANNGAFRDANIGLPFNNIGGASLTLFQNKPVAFTMINDVNILDLGGV